MGIISGAVAAYLVGCVPAARAVSRLSQRYPETQPWTPWAAGAVDFLKGFVAASLFVPTGSIGQALVVTAILAGAQWPVVGEAGRTGHWTLLGALSAITPIALPLFAVLWAVGFVASGYFAAARALGALLLPLLLGFIAGWPLGGIALPGCAMVLERCRDVLGRIRRGEEPKHHWNSAS